ncbi:MAG: AsmA-like C-terminal region-containing protein [Bacteroidales bacterium]|jgi:uncharacterized protein involved in outer membrane biogenesis|nr:AsmA-like C-terminal region-containing protein [Bacteroidales bacterium]
MVLKLLGKAGGYLLMTVAAIMAALLLITAIYGDKVTGIVIDELNSRTNMKISISDSRLTLLKRFPRASFVLSNVVIRSPQAVDGNDTLATASVLSLEFRTTNLLRKKYIIEWIGISDGRLYLLTDSSGRSNTDFPGNNQSRDDSGITLDLRNIRVTNLLLLMSNSLKETSGSALVSSARLSGAFSDHEALLKAEADLTINHLTFSDISIRKPVDAGLSLNLTKSDTLLTINRGILLIEKMAFNINGSYSLASGATSIYAGAENADIISLSGFLPENQGSWLKYKPSGTVNANCRIEGFLTSASLLHYEAAFSIDKASIEIPGTGIRFTDSFLSGFYTNGSLRNESSSQLVFDRIDIRTERSELTGKMSLMNLRSPDMIAEINAAIDLGEMKALVTNESLSEASGVVRASLAFRGDLPAKSNINPASLARLNPRAAIFLSSVSLNAGPYKLSEITGNLMISDNLWVDSLRLKLNGQAFTVDGEVSDFADWIKGDAGIVGITGFIGSPVIDPGLLTRVVTGEVAAKSRHAIALPGGYRADIAFSAGEFRHKTFTANDVSGHLSYEDGRVYIDRLSMNAMGGKLEGTMRAMQYTGRGFTTESSLAFENVDINSLFLSFGNFSQYFIMAENLRGMITGNFDLRMNLDSLLNPDFQSISSEGQFIIDDGALVSFDPIMKMSRFIEINELEDIRFSRLENEFFISSGTFAIPQMEIRSSAADLGVSGRHHFNGDYEYHLRVLLSQVLSSKAPRRTPNNEFGIVEDDGLGRTSLFLVISCNGDKETVAYDASAARGEIRKDLQQEKQSLKGILREEYGWFNRDTTIAPAKDEKPKFRIMWDEIIRTDTIVPDTIVRDRRSNPVRNLFNKIIKG